MVQLTAAGWRTAYRGIVPDVLHREPADRPAGGTTSRRDCAHPRETPSPGSPRWTAASAGYCFVAAPGREEPEGSRVAELVAIYVDPGRWRQGMGRALMERSIQEAARRGYEEIVLWTFERNGRARAFYDELGWRDDGKRRPHRASGAATLRFRRSLTLSPQASQYPAHDRHLRREARADPALRAGHVARRRQGARRDRGRDQARLERVAAPAAPGGGRGDRRARRATSTATRTPRRAAARAHRRALRDRAGPRRRLATAPARSCSRPRPRRSASRGAEIVYAWPSFSMYPYMAALSGAREIRVPLADGLVHDLDAMRRRSPPRPRSRSSATPTTRPAPTCRPSASAPSWRRCPTTSP